jgi:signal transduction histidine kinase
MTILSTTAELGNHHILICNTEGEIVVYEGFSVNPPIGQDVPMDIIGPVVDHGLFSGTDALPGIFTGNHLTVGVPVVATRTSVVFPNRVQIDTATYVLLVTVSTDVHKVLLHFLLRSFLWVGVLTLLTAFLIAYWTSRRMTKPLAGMAEAARSFGRGDFSVRLHESKRRDELGELTVAFNAMADSLGHAEELRRGFIDNVSHELRTPMTTIAGTVDGLLDGTVPGDRREEYLRTVSSEVRRLSRLVGRLSDLTRMDSQVVPFSIAPFDLSETARRVLLSFEARVGEKELPVAAAFSDGPLWALGDEDAVTQVIYNLVDNAVKFSAPGEPLMVSVTRSGTKLVFSVENGGPGIAPDDLPYVFDRFFKADRSRSADKESMGLGLYLARSILRGMDGEIRAASADGRTKFTFTLEEAAR